MSPSEQDITLITGATDGIGLALARLYQRKNRRVILLGRRPFASTPLAADFIQEQYCQIDLNRSDCGDFVVNWLEAAGITQLNALIHNAAQGFYGHTASQSIENIQEITAVNLQAPIALTHALLPIMKKPAGKVVFISSVVAGLPCPEYAVYGASKAALDSFALNLRLELSNQLHVQVIRPGATLTGMHIKSGMPSDKIDPQHFPSAESVATQIERAIAGNNADVTLGLQNRLAYWGGRYFRNWIDAALRRRYQ